MKKLFLLFAAGTMSMAASAQESTSLMFTTNRVALPAGALQPISGERAQQLRDLSPAVRDHRRGSSAARSTGSVGYCCGPYSAWYDLWNQNTSVSGGSLTAPAVGYYFALYPDSTILDDYGTSAHTNVFWHGEGMSFDPTDSGYYLAPYGYAINFGVTDDATGNPAVMPLVGTPYLIDSIAIPITYHRNDPNTSVVDSVVIELAVTRGAAGSIDSGAYTLRYNTNASFYPISYDEKPRFGTLRYSPGGSWDPAPYNTPIYVNDCYFDSVFTQKQRYTIPLSNAAPDTDANGYVYLTPGGTPNYNLQLTTPLIIYSSQVHAVSYVSFKSGASPAYALNRPASTSNLIHMYAGEPNGASTFFRQSTSNSAVSPSYNGSYQAGVYSTNQERYLHNGPIDTGFYATSVGPHDILVPSVAFIDPGTSVPEFGWHIKWAGIPVTALGVNNNVNNTIESATAFPNPANDELNVPFTLVRNADVTVSLINMVGQTVASRTMGNVSNGTAVFSTSNLPDGVYIYAIQASGERMTGHISIQH